MNLLIILKRSIYRPSMIYSRYIVYPYPWELNFCAGTILRQYHFCWQILPVAVARYAFCQHKHVSDLKVFCSTFSSQDMQRKLGLSYFKFTTSSQLFKAVNTWVLAISTTKDCQMGSYHYSFILTVILYIWEIRKQMNMLDILPIIDMHYHPGSNGNILSIG